MRRRRRARERQEKRKKKNRRLILKKLCAALLRSFRGQHGEKKGSAWGNWDPQEGQQPFRPNPNGVGDRTTTLRRLLIGAEGRVSCLQFPGQRKRMQLCIGRLVFRAVAGVTEQYSTFLPHSLVRRRGNCCEVHFPKQQQL